MSKPGLRKYRWRKDMPRVLNGLGIAIVSTSAWGDDRKTSQSPKCRWRSTVLRIINLNKTKKCHE